MRWEFNYIWLSGFFYITSIVPVIWILELHLFEVRVEKRYQLTKRTLNVTTEEENLYLSELKLSHKVFARKLCEIGLFVGLILGRWLTPRGNITRQQLSTLMLGYVCTASDILEILELFKEPVIMYRKNITVTIVLLFTVAMYQFSLVITVSEDIYTKEDTKKHSTIKIKKNKVGPVGRSTSRCMPRDKVSRDAVSKQTYILEVRKREKSKRRSERKVRGKGRKSLSKFATNVPEVKRARIRSKMTIRQMQYAELFQILVILLMQDCPFLILRIYLIAVHNVTSEMHLFFTCKNILVILLLVNRILILNCGENNYGNDNLCREEAARKLYYIKPQA